MLNVSESNLYSENARTNVTYNYTTTAADPRPIVPTAIGLYQSPRLNRRSTVTFTADFKATPSLVLSLGLIYNAAQLYNTQRTFTFTATNRAAVIGTDPLRSFAGTGAITTNPAAVVKPGETYTVLPRFEWKRGSLTVEGKFVGSISTSWYTRSRTRARPATPAVRSSPAWGCAPTTSRPSAATGNSRRRAAPTSPTAAVTPTANSRSTTAASAAPRSSAAT